MSVDPSIHGPVPPRKTATFLKICGYATVLAGYFDIRDWKSAML
ncbi:MAG: hypothetical protein WAM26_11085 [Nitrososphaeraceae archaeon]